MTSIGNRLSANVKRIFLQDSASYSRSAYGLLQAELETEQPTPSIDDPSPLLQEARQMVPPFLTAYYLSSMQAYTRPIIVYILSQGKFVGKLQHSQIL